jgi:hypothetical protein
MSYKLFKISVISTIYNYTILTLNTIFLDKVQQEDH